MLKLNIQYAKKQGNHSNFYSYKINKSLNSYHSSNDVIYG